MKNTYAVKTTSLLALGLALAACSSDDKRALVLIDIELPAGVPAPASLHVYATDATRTVKDVNPTWLNPASSTLPVGLFIPEGVVGPLNVIAEQLSGGVPILQGTVNVPALQAGGSVGPYRILLKVTGDVPVDHLDGGVDGATHDALAAEAGLGDALLLEDGASEAKPAEVGDGQSQADVPSPDGHGDVPLPDGPDAAPPVPDAPLDVPDAPPVQPDSLSDGAVDTGDAVAVHVPGWETAQNVENDMVNRSYGPAIAVDPANENVYVAWTERGAVKAKRWTKATGTWEKTVTVDNRGSPQQAEIGIDGSGNVSLIWCQDPNGTDTTLVGAWASRASGDGSAWSPPVRIGVGNAMNPRLAVARNGIARAVYQKLDVDDYWPLHAAYFDGTSWTENPSIIDPYISTIDAEALLTVSESGDGMLVFNRYAEWPDYRIAAVAFRNATFDAPTTLNVNYATIPYDGRALAMNRKGEAIFTWSEGKDYQYSLYARTYNPTTGWGAASPAIVSGGFLSPQAVTLDEQGMATITWQQKLASGKSNLMGIHGSPSKGWSDVVALETDNVAGDRTDMATDQRMTVDNDGNVLVVWRKDQSTTDVVTFGAYASSYAPATATWSPQVKLGQITGLDVVAVSLSASDKGLGAAAFVYMSDNVTDDPAAYNVFVSFYR